MKKYHVDPVTSARQEDSARIRLYRADGTTFETMADTELIFDSEAADQEAKTTGTRKRMNKSARVLVNGNDYDTDRHSTCPLQLVTLLERREARPNQY